jgi:hypothetical protein
MPRFILVYRYPQGYDVLTDPSANEAWEAYIRENVGPNVADPGWPVFEEATVVGNTAYPTKLGGYSVVDVADLDAAVALTERCPTLSKGGSVEVGPLVELPAAHPAEVLRKKTAQPSG